MAALFSQELQASALRECLIEMQDHKAWHQDLPDLPCRIVRTWTLTTTGPTKAQVQAQTTEIKMLSHQIEDVPGGTEVTQPLMLLFSSVSATFPFEVGTFGTFDAFGTFGTFYILFISLPLL